MRQRVNHVDVISGLILVLGIAGMFLAARSAQPLIVTDQDCVEFWNNTPVHPIELPTEVTLRVLGEGEQDLGYGLCWLRWADTDGQCQKVSSPVWKDTETWETRVSLRRCDNATLGGAVTLLADGRLRLEG